MTTVIARFGRLAARPPMWMRVLDVPMGALVRSVWSENVGGHSSPSPQFVYGGLGLAVAIFPSRVVGWSRRHPNLDGSILGPLVFLAVAYLTAWPWWSCLIAALAVERHTDRLGRSPRERMGATRLVSRALHYA